MNPLKSFDSVTEPHAGWMVLVWVQPTMVPSPVLNVSDRAVTGPPMAGVNVVIV